MKYDISVGISNRHVHLTEEMYNKLFDEPIEKRNDLHQIGQFAAKQTLTLKNGDKVIENVRVLGPFRKYNQIELSKKDARTLDLNPPVRTSGDLENTPSITLVTKKSEVTIDGVIIADRHVHMNPIDAEKYGVVNGQKVRIEIPGDKSGVIDAYIKISDDGYYELHVDTDDGNAFLLNDNDILKMIID